MFCQRTCQWQYHGVEMVVFCRGKYTSRVFRKMDRANKKAVLKKKLKKTHDLRLGLRFTFQGDKNTQKETEWKG